VRVKVRNYNVTHGGGKRGSFPWHSGDEDQGAHTSTLRRDKDLRYEGEKKKGKVKTENTTTSNHDASCLDEGHSVPPYIGSDIRKGNDSRVITPIRPASSEEPDAGRRRGASLGRETRGGRG